MLLESKMGATAACSAMGAMEASSAAMGMLTRTGRSVSSYALWGKSSGGRNNAPAIASRVKTMTKHLNMAVDLVVTRNLRTQNPAQGWIDAARGENTLGGVAPIPFQLKLTPIQSSSPGAHKKPRTGNSEQRWIACAEPAAKGRKPLVYVPGWLPPWAEMPLTGSRILLSLSEGDVTSSVSESGSKTRAHAEACKQCMHHFKAESAISLKLI